MNTLNSICSSTHQYHSVALLQPPWDKRTVLNHTLNILLRWEETSQQITSKKLACDSGHNSVNSKHNQVQAVSN